MNRREMFATSATAASAALLGSSVNAAAESDDALPITPDWIRSEKPELSLISTDASLAWLDGVLRDYREGDSITVSLHNTEIKTRGHLRRVLAAVKGE